MKTLSDIIDSFAKTRHMPSLNVLRVASAVKEGETVTFGSIVFEADLTAVASITGSNVRVDLSASSAMAAGTGTLTSDNTNVADGATVTIGNKVYTFKTSLTPTEGEVLIGADADASLLNLIRAINHTGTPNTDYKCAAAHTQVTAAASVTTHAFAITAIQKGTVAAAAIATTETSTHLSWGSTTMTGGTDPSASEYTTALALAMNGTSNGGLVEAVRVSANEVLVIDRSSNSHVAKACTETLTGSNNAWANATSYGGAGTPDSIPNVALVKRAAIAQEVTLGNLHFVFDFAPVSAFVQVRDSSGVAKAWDGAVTITGKRVIVDNTGSTDWAATDVVTLLASQ